jgi:LacI family transcriptional regulator
MANIKDVAKLANVSVATVSRVINNKGYVNEETRKLVEDAIKTLNYIPNEFARSLFKKVSKTIGVIFPHLINSFYYNVLEGIEEEAFNNGYKVMICNSHEDDIREEEYIKQFVKYNIDGLITGSNSNLLYKYRELKIPIVSIDRRIDADIPSVTSDNYGGGYLAAEKLISSGCKYLVHFRGPSILLTVQDRTRGYDKCLSEKGMFSWQVDLDFLEPDINIIRSFLSVHEAIDGVFCDNDIIAAHVISELHRMGKRIPQDVQIIGYDNTYLAHLITPKLSTVSQRMFDIGKEAMISLNHLLSGEKEFNFHKLIPVDYISRETTR